MAAAAGGLVSNAALCTLTASFLEGDVVLKLVLHLASDHQVKVQVPLPVLEAKQKQQQNS